MNRGFAIIAGLVLLGVLVLFSTTYSVRFNEVAVRTTFGASSTARVTSEPGLHFRLPLFADRVSTFDTRLQLAETPLVEVPTADGQSVVVRAFLMWRIDPDRVLDFAAGFATLRDAEADLKGQLQTAVKGGLGRYTFDELIGPGSRLADAEREVLAQLSSAVGALGVTPQVVGISQVKLPEKTTAAVLSRMEETRKTLAENERSIGNSEAARIQAETRTLIDKLVAFARQRAEEIKGLGSQRREAYLRQMDQEPEFARYLLELEQLKAAFNDLTTIVIGDDQAPFSLLRSGGDAPVSGGS
jgi:membrane protease subunit HflC